MAASIRSILTTSVFKQADAASGLGNDCYSYHFVQRAFLPLLQRWGTVEETTPADLAAACDRARRDGREPVHVSFLPPQYMPLAEGIPNLCVPFWEYPDIPAHDVGGDPQRNWLRVINRLTAVIAACDFTREAFRRAGATLPIHLAPVPIAPAYFDVPAWEPRQHACLRVTHFDLGRQSPSEPTAEAPAVSPAPAGGLHGWLRQTYRGTLKPLVPMAWRDALARAGRRALVSREAPATVKPAWPCEPQDVLSLQGVVYTSVFNPFDERKNWRDILTAFLWTLGDRSDATLVFKLAVSRGLAVRAVQELHAEFHRVAGRRQARVAAIADYLDDGAMLQLARSTTFYANASRAEGACLPLQDYLAAGRPGIAPRHSAMAEYFDDRIGLPVRSSREPTHFSWDSARRLATTWDRIDWDSLCNAFSDSYRLATEQPEDYAAMAARGRDRMRRHAHPDAVWAALQPALDAAMPRVRAA